MAGYPSGGGSGYSSGGGGYPSGGPAYPGATPAAYSGGALGVPAHSSAPALGVGGGYSPQSGSDHYSLGAIGNPPTSTPYLDYSSPPQFASTPMGNSTDIPPALAPYSSSQPAYAPQGHHNPPPFNSSPQQQYQQQQSFGQQAMLQGGGTPMGGGGKEQPDPAAFGIHPSQANPVHQPFTGPQSVETYFPASFPHNVRLHGYLTVIFEAGRGLPARDSNGRCDPYCQLLVDKSRLVKTLACAATLTPQFREKHVVPVCHTGTRIDVTVKDEDLFGADDIGAVSVDVSRMLAGGYTDIAWHTITDAKGRPQGEVAFSITYQSIRDKRMPKSLRIPYTVFPLHYGCYVRMYQDAHVSPYDVVSKYNVETALGKYNNSCAWEDVFRSFMRAQRFIYVCGWSVWTELILFRERAVDGVQEGTVKLGNLLVDKARSGVQVMVMQWDEITSNSSLALVGKMISEGLMGTHDEESEAFFKNTPVRFVKVSRGGKQANRSIVYTHHQKAIVCDAPHPTHAPMKMVTAYVGGLDLCDGRFDSPTHPLFLTLNTWHKDDFHSPSTKGVTAANGPRQPWHDVHMYVEGPAALDVKKNFDDRWLMCGDPSVLGPPYRLPTDFVSSEQHTVVAPSPHAWACQLMRSIDGFSASGLPAGCRREATIHQAYVHMIRRAERFIYIENQYFLGSSHLWGDLTSTQPNARNLIPAELALRICQKIQAQEPFCVYVVMPLYPEGVPGAGPTQAILRWQHYTMATMYRMIAVTMQQCGVRGFPTDYLQFFFIGAREGPSTTPTPPPLSKAGKLMHSNRRHQIYVHSKFMVIDDEQLICGSVVEGGDGSDPMYVSVPSTDFHRCFCI